MGKVTAAVLRLLAFLRLVDLHDSSLSLTSIALIVVLVKLALTPDPSVEHLGALCLALLAAAHKKALGHDTSRANRVDAEHIKKLAELVNTVKALEVGSAKLEAHIGRVDARTAPAPRGFDQPRASQRP